MVSRRTNFGEQSEPAPDRGGKLQSAGGGGAAQSNVSPLQDGLSLFNNNEQKIATQGRGFPLVLNKRKRIAGA